MNSPKTAPINKINIFFENIQEVFHMNSLIKLLEDFELKEGLISEKLIAEEILQLLDMIFIETRNGLMNQQHQTVLGVLITLIKFDGRLKDMIYIRTNSEDETKEEIFDYLELQAQVNTFRNKLIEELVHYLCDRYEHSRQLAKIDKNMASKIFKATKNVNDFYINELLKQFEQENIDSSEMYRVKTCKETISTLEEVSNIALKNLFNLAKE